MILPRGHHAGGRRYTFPALVQPQGLKQLIAQSLRSVGSAVGNSNLRADRLILTGHSGGGAAVLSILRHTDPDEFHLFDGLYNDPANLIRWVLARLGCERAGCDRPPGSLRVLFRAGEGTAVNSRRVHAAIEAQLSREPRSAPALRRRCRVEPVSTPHNGIPREFGWRLLADPASEITARHR